MSTDENVKRIGADGETVDTPQAPAETVIEAQVPGDDPAKFTTLTLAHPLNKQTKEFLGLPADSRAEVGAKVRVNKNGARALINAGLVCVDPEDRAAVREALTPDAEQAAASESVVAEAPAADVQAAGPTGTETVAPSSDATVTGEGGDAMPPAGEATVSQPSEGDATAAPASGTTTSRKSRG